MRFQTALIAAVLCVASSALAQAPAASTPSKPAVPAKPAQPQAETHAKPDAPLAATEKLDPAEDAAIRHLLDITEESKLGERMSNFFTGRVREKMSQMLPPDRLPKFMETFTQKFDASIPPTSVEDAQVMIYAKHFSKEDIQALVRFYETPTGQRVVKVMAQVNRESQGAGQEIDQKAALDVLREMSDEYTELKAILPPEPLKPGAAPAPAGTPATPPTPAAAPTAAPAPAPGAAPAPKPAPAPQR
jgi:hypothetical protein